MTDWSQPLEKAKPEAPPPTDPAVYRPIPGRPGWLVNGRGQMAREGATPTQPLPDLFKGLVPVVKG